MSMTTLVHGKAVVSPYISEERNPFDELYRKAKEIMDHTEYRWFNRRQIGFAWNFERKCYELEIQDPETGRVIESFTATKAAISKWASLSRPVWTVVTHKTPEQEIATALSVLTDQYAILSYTDIVSAVEQICREISGITNTEVQGFEVHPDYLKANIIMGDLAIPMPSGVPMDVITVGVQVSSGLTGDAAVKIVPWAKRIKCDNSLMFGDDTTKNFDKERTVKMVHRWGGMRYDPAERQGEGFVLGEQNFSYLRGNAEQVLLEERTQRIGWKYRNKLWTAVQSNLEDATMIVRGAAVAANTPIPEGEGPALLGSIIDQWLGEAPADGVDLRKKELKKFEYFKDDGSRANFLQRISQQLEFYGRQMGYSMYSIIQALTEHKILVDLPPDVRVVVEDWAARYCFNLSEQYNPNVTPVERLDPNEVIEILRSLKY
ncbi:MAG: hypothetical protein ACTSPB_20585 [Candidatus Thorarchaeota archaeon]